MKPVILVEYLGEEDLVEMLRMRRYEKKKLTSTIVAEKCEDGDYELTITDEIECDCHGRNE